ncbi:MAG: bifunctional oligoribonuclease/PAP phosphatase NrnA [Firmicutes bacterium]|nr:bifunctional oligoribonuclease/PAP phosphatase NrnA [Bacillota bacterium]
MNTELKNKIFEKIRNYNRIILMRHIRPDGDAVGSTMGLKALIKAAFPQKEVYIINEDFSDYLSFLGGEDADISREMYGEALGIVLDTASPERISNKKYVLCKELIKIDHHINISPYGDISWVEEERSSLCEMIADFYITFSSELTLPKEAATYIYLGMVTDSGRFRTVSTNSETLQCAAVMLGAGIDTDRLYANLYLEEYDFYKYKAFIYRNMKLTKNGVAYIYIDRKTQERFGLTTEQACNAVSFLDSIKNSIIWLAFIEYPDESIRVRLRSRFVTINQLAEKYSGGGHDRASGATVGSVKEMRALIRDADKLIKEYKETHEGWL